MTTMQQTTTNPTKPETIEGALKSMAANSKAGDDPELAKMAEWINTEYLDIEKAESAAITQRRTILDRAIRLGKVLNQAKDRAGHGKWLTWLATNCKDVNERTAQRYMNLAKNEETLREKMKSDTMSDLTLNQAKKLTDETSETGDTDTSNIGDASEQSSAQGSGKKNNSDKYDSAEDNLIKKLQALSTDDADAAATKTIDRLQKEVAAKKAEAFEAMKQAAKIKKAA